MSTVFKKLLSVILALSVAISVMSTGFTAFAFEGEPDEALTLGTPITVNGSGVYSFTAEVAGGYIFYSENGNDADPYAELYDSNQNFIGNEDDTNGLNFELSIHLDAGETCYLEVYSYHGGEFAVGVKNTNIQSISVVNHGFTGYSEKDALNSGYWDGDYDHYGNLVGGEYFRYNTDTDEMLEALIIEVTYNDGTPTEQIGYWDDGGRTGVMVSDNQSYENQWSPEGTNNKITVSYKGVSTTIDVEIAPTNVKSISVDPSCELTFIEHDGRYGYWKRCYEQGEYKGEFFYYYSEAIAHTLKINVEYKDDKPDETITYLSGDYEWSGMSLYFDQSYQNPFTDDGDNVATVRYMGAETTTNVTILPNAVESISVKSCDFKYTEYDEGYGWWRNDCDGSDYTSTGEYFYYEPRYVAEAVELEVTYNDDRPSETIGYYIGEGEDAVWSGIEYDYEQSSQNPWTVGGNNTITFSYMGKTCEYTAVIEKGEIDHIELNECSFSYPCFDTDYGVWRYHNNERYFYYDPMYVVQNTTLKVVYTDENRDPDIISAYNDEEGTGFSYSYSQSYYNQWTPGGQNKITFVYKGHKVDYSAVVEESPVASIAVVSCNFEYTEYDETYGWIEYEDWFTLSGEYFYYDIYPILENVIVRVTFKDGSDPIEIGYWDDEGEKTDLEFYSNQTENHWQAGSDNNIVTFSYLGAEVDYPITVNASPVESIELVTPQSITFNEYDDSDDEWRGYWTTTDGIEYFYYNVDSLLNQLKVRVNYTEESGIDSKIIGYYNDEGDRTGLSLSHNQTPYNPWTPERENKITLSYMGKSIEVPVEIIPTDVESIEYVSGEFTYTEGNTSQGWWNEYDEWDDDSSEYFYYDPDYIARNATILVTYTAESGKEPEQISYWDPNEEDSSTGITVLTNQSYRNQWSVDNDNMQATLRYRGKTCSAPVSIQKDPIESIEVISGGNYQFFKNDENCGEWREGYDWDGAYMGDYFHYETYRAMQDVVIRVYYTDGTHEDISYQDSDEIEFGSTQDWYNQWNDENSDRSIDIYYRGHKTSFPANVIDTTIESIEITENSYAYDAYKYGSWNSYYEAGKEKYYYWYSAPEMLRGLTLTVNYKEGYGETETLTDLYELYNDWEAWEASGITINSNQSTENPWLPDGNNTVTITYKGMSVDIPVTINPCRVTGIELESNDFYFIENDYHTGMDAEVGEEENLVKYFQYDPNQVLYNGAKFRVYYQDGSEEVIDYGSAYEYELFVYSNQSYNNQWQVGTENNTITVIYGGAQYSFDVEVKETEVASITVNDGGYKFIEGVNLENWYSYNLSEFMGNLNLHITYKNGEEEDIGSDYSLNWYDESGTAIFTNETAENPWVVGGENNIIYICYKGLTVEHPATLIANPVESIRVIDDGGATLIRNDNGYFDIDNYGNDMYYYHTEELKKNLVFEITYVGGETEEKTYEELTQSSYFSEYEGQHENYWDIDRDNQIEFWYYGRTETYNVTIEESPVTEIEVIGADTFWLIAEDGDYGWWDEGNFYYSEDKIGENIRLKVTYMDGDEEKTEIVDYRPYKYSGTNFNITTNQYENPWEVGGENQIVTVTCMGYSVSFDIQVKTPTEEMYNPTAIEFVRAYEDAEYVKEDLSHGWWLKDDESSPEYFYYDPSGYIYNCVFKVTFEAGNTEYINYGDYPWNDYFQYEAVQSHLTPWGVGEDNAVTVTFGEDVSTTVNVEIIETDVESISVVNEDDYKLIKNNGAQGYYTQEDSPNGDIWFKYTNFGDNSIKLVVTYKNGTTETIYVNSDGVCAESDQTYENQWTVGGENNTVTYNYRGVSCTYDLEVVDSPFDEYPDFEISIIDYDNKKVAIGDYYGESTDVVIPEKIGEYTVTVITSWAFEYDDITSIVLPKTIESIYYGAFYDCDLLSDIYFMGSESAWNEVEIDNDNDYNIAIYSANIHFGIDENGNCTHLFTEIVGATEPTCVEMGYTGDKVCTACGETAEYGEEIPVTDEHIFTTYNSDNNAKCEKDGTKTAICDRVGCYKTHTVTDEGTALTHDFDWVIDKAPSCQPGYGHDECIYCGKTQNENTSIPATGTHTVTDCTTGLCVGCGEPVNDQPNVEHSFGEYQYNNDATCTESGTQTAHCTVENCQGVDIKPYSALGHDWDNDCDTLCNRGCGETREPNHTGGTATCVDKKVCTTCGDPYGEVDGDNHKSATHYEKQEANCSKTGLTAGFECTACGVDTREVIEKNDNHSYSTYTYNNDATCEEDGTETAQCDNGCGGTNTLTAEDTALGHSFTSYESDGDATCTEDGHETAICDRDGCNATDNRAVVDSALGHTGGTATCVDKKVCTRCEEQYGDVDSNNHSYSSDCDTTCNNDCGAEQRTDTAEHSYTDCEDTECNECGETRVAPGHTGGTATCTEQARCERCGNRYGTVNNDNHSYIGTCGTVCQNGCGISRTDTAEHDYTDCADAECNTCHETRVAPGHTGGTATCVDRAICDNCDEPYGEVNANNHSYIGACGTVCQNECGVARTDTADHTYTDCEDTECNICGETRTAPGHTGGTATCVDKKVCTACGDAYGEVDSTNHSYIGACGTVCQNDCGVARTDTADHAYTDCEDAECNVCGETRTAPGHTGGSANCATGKVCEICHTEYTAADRKYHIFSSDCDTTCNNAECGSTREAPEEHDYDDCLDTTCDNCGTTRVVTGHAGGTANCKDKAKCTVCGKAYGEINKNNHKSAINYNAVAATCTNEGSTAGFKCNACGVDTRKVVNKKAHSYGANYVSKAATEKATGTISKKCACGDVAYVSTIAKIKTVKLSTTSYTYNGKSKKPSVTVKDSKGNKLVKDTDYTVKYSNNKKVGKATVKVTFKGKYSGTKTLTFKINPKATKISSLKAGKKAFTVKYSKQTSGSGYEIQYSTSSKFKSAKTVKITKNKTVSKTVKKLKAKKTYYVRVRVVKGSYKSAWSASKKVKTK